MTRLSSKSFPAVTNWPPNASIAAFFSLELPSGTTMIDGIPLRAAAIATDWPWLPRVAVTSPLGKLP